MCCYEGWDYTGIFACDGMQNSDFFFQNTWVSSGGPCFGGGLYVLYLLKSRLKVEDVNKQRRNFISGKFRKSGQKVNGTRLFGSFQGYFPATTEHLIRLSSFSGENVPNGNSWSISSKSSLTPVSGLRGRFSVNGTDSYKW